MRRRGNIIYCNLYRFKSFILEINVIKENKKICDSPFVDNSLAVDNLTASLSSITKNYIHSRAYFNKYYILLIISTIIY